VKLKDKELAIVAGEDGSIRVEYSGGNEDEMLNESHMVLLGLMIKLEEEPFAQYLVDTFRLKYLEDEEDTPPTTTKELH